MSKKDGSPTWRDSKEEEEVIEKRTLVPMEDLILGELYLVHSNRFQTPMKFQKMDENGNPVFWNEKCCCSHTSSKFKHFQRYTRPIADKIIELSKKECNASKRDCDNDKSRTCEYNGGKKRKLCLSKKNKSIRNKNKKNKSKKNKSKKNKYSKM